MYIPFLYAMCFYIQIMCAMCIHYVPLEATISSEYLILCGKRKTPSTVIYLHYNIENQGKSWPLGKVMRFSYDMLISRKVPPTFTILTPYFP